MDSIRQDYQKKQIKKHQKFLLKLLHLHIGDYYPLRKYLGIRCKGGISYKGKIDEITHLSIAYNKKETKNGTQITRTYQSKDLGYKLNLILDKIPQLSFAIPALLQPAYGLGALAFFFLTQTTYQPSSKDNHILSSSPDTNYGGADQLKLHDYVDGYNRSILEFDISDISGEVVFSQGDLELYYYAYFQNDPVGKTTWAYKLTRTDWVELEATFNIYKTGSSWTVAGGDFVTSAPAGGSVNAPAGYGWVTWNILAITQDAYDSSDNVEILVKFANEDALIAARSTMWFASNDYTDDTNLRPKLTVTYTIPPTPVKIEKDLIYKVLPSITIQKTLKYCVPTTPSALTKSLEYIVNPSPPQEILSGKSVVVSDTTTATTPEDIDGSSFNITLKNEGYIMAFMSLTSNIGASDKKIGYFGININGVDSPFINRYHFTEKNGNVEVVFRSGLLQPGQYAVKGRHYIEAGVTLTSKNVTLVAFTTEDEGGNRINSIYDTVASDTVTGSTPEDIDGLTQDITVNVLSFILAMIVGSVSVNVKDKLYRLILSVNGIIMGVERFLDSVDDIGAAGVVCRSQIPETAGQITVKGRHASEAGVIGKIEPAIMVGLALSTKSGEVGYVIPSGAICIQGATMSTTSEVLVDIPTIEVEVTLTQEAHIFAVMTFQTESEKSNMENYFAIRIGSIDFEECLRTANVKLDNTIITVVARTTAKLAAGTYAIKGRWRTTAGNTLRAINDASIVAVGLETTTQDLPTHILRSLDYKVSSTVKMTKDLEYMVFMEPSVIEKQLKYNIFLGATALQKSLQYTIKKVIKIEKGLIYKVLPSIAINKTLKYCILTIPVAKQKELKYTILTEPAALTKELKYHILTIPSAIEKDLIYDVLTQTKIEKSLQYEVLSEQAITKSLKYCVITIPTVTTKLLEYQIITIPSITKSLKYQVLTIPSAITKSLIYGILIQTGIEKSLLYHIRIYPYDPMDSPYVPFPR